MTGPAWLPGVVQRGRRDGLGGPVTRAEHLGDQRIDLVADRVVPRRGQQRPGYEDRSDNAVSQDGQDGGRDQRQNGPQHVLHDSIVGGPAVTGHRGTTSSGPRIVRGGGPVVPRHEAGRDGTRTAPIRVVIVDDHVLVREGTAQLLDQEPGLEVVGEAGSAEEAVDLLATVQPDVALVDVNLPGRSGLELARWASGREPPLRILVLSAYDDFAFVDEALNAGVGGYLLKTASARELVEAVRAVVEGIFVLDGAISRRLARRLTSDSARPATALTRREADVWNLVSRGWSNKRIASELGLGVRTVEGYVSSLLAKLGVGSRTEAALYALDQHQPTRDENA